MMSTDTGSKDRFHRERLVAGFLVLTLAKLAATVWVGGSGDVRHRHAEAVAYLAGRNVFEPENTGNNPGFFPGGHYGLAAGSLLLAERLGLAFDVVMKWPAILADYGICLLLLRTGGAKAALLYLASPLTAMLSVYHGQFHTVALLALLLSLGAAEGWKERIAGMFLAVASSIRQHVALLVVPLTRCLPGARLPFLGFFSLAIVALNLPLVVISGGSMVRLATPAVNYGAWGWSMLLLQGPRLLDLAGLSFAERGLRSVNAAVWLHADKLGALWGLAFLILATSRPDWTPWRSAFVYTLGLYTFHPGVAVQWLIYGLPLFLLLEPQMAVAYSALASAFVLGSYWQWTLNRRYGVASLTANLGLLSIAELAGVVAVGVLGFLIWLLCIAALFRQLRRPLSAQPEVKMN